MAHGREDFTYLADTDIIAQTIGNIAVDLVAQTIGNLAVNVAAQDLAQLLINIVAQNVGVYLQPEWAALQGTDKDLQGLNQNCGYYTSTKIVEYEVPTGKTLYISHFGAEAEEVPCAVRICMREGVAQSNKAVTGGMQGGGMALNKPVVFTAGQKAQLWVTQFATSAQGVIAHMGGYEI